MICSGEREKQEVSNPGFSSRHDALGLRRLESVVVAHLLGRLWTVSCNAANRISGPVEIAVS